MITADDIILAARECVDTPFRHQGRMVGLGLDCAGVVAHVVRVLDLPICDQTDYGRTPNAGQLQAALDCQPSLQRVDDAVDQILPADILLMRFLLEPQHLAIYTGESIIHAYEKAGLVAEHALSEAWAKRIVAVYRVIGITV